MSLKEYRAKRDFARSPEPRGDERLATTRKARSARFFCVQKHLATQLHYDFRLELGGVLLSWAVPKGPSLDPAVKRLAMQVEDHPLEYGQFEGVIPEGYGAGVVMLWDYGTWTPQVDDVEGALAKGDLKFTLDGYKLKGSWVLVRTKGWSGGGRSGSTGEGRAWLLIKHRDEWSGPLDITEFAPLSVKSESDFADIIAQDAPDIWLSNVRGAERRASLGSLAEIVKKVERLTASRARQAETTTAPKAGAAARTSTRGGAVARARPARKAKR